jgi:hypothetical protein
MIFYLGTHLPSWLRKTDVPLFLSARRLRGYKTLPRARGPWALDSGGFSELSMFGAWTIPPRQYVAEVRRWATEIGNMQWAAVQDWMCEPPILRSTGLTVQEHQARTIRSYLELCDAAPEIPWTPVLQGWELSDYARHAGAYTRAGVDLRALPIVGLGSVCRRQGTQHTETLIRGFAACGVRLHGFGVKQTGLRRAAGALASADSMAWSFTARRLQRPLLGCHGHKNCANCLVFALHWRERLLTPL